MELPDYLKNIEINPFRAPATNVETDLPFELLEPRIFERFCCELIQSKMENEPGNDVVDILPIGVSGQQQYGADIFAKENIDSNEKFTLYEVKRVRSYSLSEYKKSVKRFLDNYNKWGFEIAEFNLLVAEDISAENIALWQREAYQLSQKSIVYRVIPSSTLNRWTKNFPKLVYKYFHPAWTEMLFGKSAIWHFEKYGIWSFEESASWEKYTGPEQTSYGDSLSYINDHVKIHAFLPSLEKNSASCYVEFRNGRFSHVMITLDHKQLVNDFFPASKIPIPDNIRPFLLKSIDGDGYFCDIGNCRIKLSVDEAKSLCDVFDVFWNEYKQRVKNIESSWRSKYFNYGTKSAEDIPLLRIKRGLWSLLLDFAKCHDAFNTTGKWSIFDSCPGWLKIYTSSVSEDMEAGHHAFIKPKKYEGIFNDFRWVDDDVVLVWQPPNNFMISQEGTVISPRYYWDAETTHNWLKNCLIPQALEWDRRNKKIGIIRRIKRLLRRFLNQESTELVEYNPDDYIVSFYEPCPSRDLDMIEDIEGLHLIANRLQSFFNGNPKYIYLNEDCYKKLYISLAEVLSKTEDYDFSYLQGNLNYLHATDMKSLIEAVRKHASKPSSGCDKTFLVDCVLRCILVSIRDYKNHLNNYEIRNIVTDIYPLLELMEDRKLLIRQARFFD
ncbi:hypothetical protein [Acaryochloris sp. IP29b_bin.148]|uniref:hypothetical protein n=1 Tax=Acaryochloris sp. IP29b_bin.148 TaxID=2969218 RepID=UPI0026322B0E|nr:hypothetical protein [Acaryochloris sp. IP29b_bin.148]